MTKPNYPKLPDIGELDVVHDIEMMGWNRADGACLIDARNDFDAVITWLKEFTDKPNTFNNYRKEAQRFLSWALKKRGKSLSSITRDDVIAYDAYMANPDWEDTGPTRPLDHPDWRPFARWHDKPAGLSESSRNLAMIILGSLFAYLIDAGFLQRNPFALKRRKRNTENHAASERLLEKDCFNFLMSFIENMPRETDRQIAQAERTRWIFTIFYQAALRLREVSNSNMGCFHLIRKQWWIVVVGKGNKTGKVPVTPTLLEALKRYRTHLGLETDLPKVDESTPLVCTLTSFKSETPAGIDGSALHKIIKDTFAQASAAAKLEGLDNIAHKLAQASTHWLRHTSASHQLDAGVPITIARKNLRHANITTTQIYLHTEDDTQHEASIAWDRHQND